MNKITADFKIGDPVNLEMPYLFQKWYNTMIRKGYGNEVSQMISALVSYQSGEVTLSQSVKEKLSEMDIIDRDGIIKIKEPNELRWYELAIRLQTNYINNNYRF